MKIVHLILAATLVWCPVNLQAAKAPLSQKELRQQSDLIVTGRVEEITSTVQKSEIERGTIGVHRDRVYTIRLGAFKVHQQKAGAKPLKSPLSIQAWKPALRLPPLPGLQGHESIPGKGDTVKMYLKWNQPKAVWEPLLPNGIDVLKPAPPVK